MAGDFREICDEFNKSAKDLPRGGRTADIMLTRYALLLRHKAETEEEKAELVRTLYECGRETLKVFSGPKASDWIPDVTPGNVEAVFRALREPESLKYVPHEAPKELAEIALDLLKKADTAKSDRFSSYNRYEGYIRHMVSFSRIALETADACKTAIEDPLIDIRTSKPITAQRRLVLKPSTPKPPSDT